MVEQDAKSEDLRVQRAAIELNMKQEEDRKEALRLKSIDDTSKAAELLRLQNAKDFAMLQANEAAELQLKARRDEMEEKVKQVAVTHKAILADTEQERVAEQMAHEKMKMNVNMIANN